MNEFYRAKFNELFVEFSRYLVEYPEFADKIPDGAEVMLLDSRDPGYNQYMLSLVRTTPPDHPIAYIKVGELSPVRSRLRNPQVILSPAAFALA